MNLKHWRDNHLNNGNIYLSPKNDLSIALKNELTHLGVMCVGFVDSYKEDDDVIRPYELSINDTLLIFSPNYWQEIACNSKVADVYIFYSDAEGDQVIPVSDFTGYRDNNSFNSLFAQRMYWGAHLKEHMHTTQDLSDYGFAWGDPENANDELGNYLAITQQLKQLITSHSHVVELGTLGGKWTKYLLNAKRVTCVDINDEMISAIKYRYPGSLAKINFYVSSGDELNGIDTDSVNLVFCIDTLVRSSECIIHSYLQEISRVLCAGGKALMHLPSNKIAGSIERGFTGLCIDELIIAQQENFSKIMVDNKLLNHGAWLIFKNKK